MAKAGRPKGLKKNRHNIVLPVRTSKALRKYSKMVEASISEVLEVSFMRLLYAREKEQINTGTVTVSDSNSVTNTDA